MDRSWWGVEDDMPLALLAAAAHPRPEVRRRIARTLDALIEASGPLHSEGRVRRVLARQMGNPSGPHHLVAAREVAVRVLRLAFAGERVRRQWVYIEDCRPPTRCDAFFINYLLRVVPLKQARFTGCPCPLDSACRFDGGRVITRLQEFGGPGPWL